MCLTIRFAEEGHCTITTNNGPFSSAPSTSSQLNNTNRQFVLSLALNDPNAIVAWIDLHCFGTNVCEVKLEQLTCIYIDLY